MTPATTGLVLCAVILLGVVVLMLIAIVGVLGRAASALERIDDRQAQRDQRVGLGPSAAATWRPDAHPLSVQEAADELRIPLTPEAAARAERILDDELAPRRRRYTDTPEDPTR